MAKPFGFLNSYLDQVKRELQIVNSEGASLKKRHKTMHKDGIEASLLRMIEYSAKAQETLRQTVEKVQEKSADVKVKE